MAPFLLLAAVAVGSVHAETKAELVKLPISQTEIDLTPLIGMKGMSAPQLVEAIEKEGIQLIAHELKGPNGEKIGIPEGVKKFDWSFIKTDEKVSEYYKASPRYSAISVSNGRTSVRGATFLAPFAGTTWNETKDRPLRDKPIILINTLSGPDSLLHEFVHYLIWKKRNEAPIEVDGVKVHRPDYVVREIYNRKRRVEAKPAWGELGKLSEHEWLAILDLEVPAVISSAEEIDVTYVTGILEAKLKLHSNPAYRSEQLGYRVRQCDRLKDVLEEHLVRIANLKQTKTYLTDAKFEDRIRELETFFLKTTERVAQARSESLDALKE
jgi:hypothetical protein